MRFGFLSPQHEEPDRPLVLARARAVFLSGLDLDSTELPDDSDSPDQDPKASFASYHASNGSFDASTGDAPIGACVRAACCRHRGRLLRLVGCTAVGVVEPAILLTPVCGALCVGVGPARSVAAVGRAGERCASASVPGGRVLRRRKVLRCSVLAPGTYDSKVGSKGEV